MIMVIGVKELKLCYFACMFWSGITIMHFPNTISSVCMYIIIRMVYKVPCKEFVLIKALLRTKSLQHTNTQKAEKESSISCTHRSANSVQVNAFSFSGPYISIFHALIMKTKPWGSDINPIRYTHKP